MELPMNPKLKAKIDVQYGEAIDRISDLPEDLISRILSLMPTKLAVRTSILSNRWKYLWTSITNLDFDHQFPRASFINFVNRVLRLCKSSRIQLFRLSCYNPKNLGLPVEKWISEAIRLHASEIVIEFTRHSLPPSLFICKTLRTLKLESFGLEIPSSISLPNLKILSIFRLAEDMLERLIYGYPMLEDLSFVGNITNQNKFVLSITTPTMKRLTFRPILFLDDITKIVINTPNLECLHISNIINFRLGELQSLVEASLDLEYYDSEDEYDWICKQLREISRVKSLSLYCCVFAVFEFLHNKELPVFHYLTRLEMVFGGCNSCKFLPLFLECSPNLQYLSLEKKISWFGDFVLPLRCSLLHLEEIKLKGFTGKKGDLPILKYLLKNAKVLKLLKIVCEQLTVEKEREFYNNLLELWKVARTCKIEFHGRHLQITSLQVDSVKSNLFVSKVSLEKNGQGK